MRSFVLVLVFGFVNIMTDTEHLFKPFSYFRNGTAPKVLYRITT